MFFILVVSESTLSFLFVLISHSKLSLCKETFPLISVTQRIYA